MHLNPLATQRMQAQRKLQEQIFIDPSMETVGFPVQPWTPYYRTNNFIQNTASRVMGFNPAEKKWRPAFVDEQGRLLTSPDPTAGMHVLLKNRETVTIKEFENEVVPATTAITHVGEDVREFLNKTIMISTSGAATVYVQFSDDNVNFYEWKSIEDSDLTFACTNEKICFGFQDHARYVRIVIYNSSSSNNTVSLTILGAV